MKKPYLILILILGPVLSTMAQNTSDSYSTFLNPNYYKGKTLLLKSHIYHKANDYSLSFFLSSDDKHSKNNVPYPIDLGDGLYGSVFDSLKNKRFVCIDIITDKDGISEPFLKLSNEKTGFIYIQKHNARADLMTIEEFNSEKADSIKLATESKKEIDDYRNLLNNPCLNIEDRYDNFNYTKEFSTAMSMPLNPAKQLSDRSLDITFHKYVSKTTVSYFIRISTTDISPDVTQKGVIIILENGKRLNKPLAAVSAGVSGTEFTRSTFIKLTPNDIELLKSSPIKEYELYISQDVEHNGEFIRQMFLCLLTKK